MSSSSTSTNGSATKNYPAAFSSLQTTFGFGGAILTRVPIPPTSRHSAESASTRDAPLSRETSSQPLTRTSSLSRKSSANAAAPSKSAKRFNYGLGAVSVQSGVATSFFYCSS
ncbi:hypothetical protein BDN72DRAFT_835423, partial [Pluteus cervinus]